MSDDDLRFGDISDSPGSGDATGGEWIIELFTNLFVGLVLFYVLLSLMENLFNIPIPFI